MLLPQSGKYDGMVLLLFLVLLQLDLLLPLPDLLLNTFDFEIALDLDHALPNLDEREDVAVGSRKSLPELFRFLKDLVIKGLQGVLNFLLLPFQEPTVFDVGMRVEGG